MAPELKVGDTVRLKSGGPIMTVDRANKEMIMCYCVYFHEGKAYGMDSQIYFQHDVLEKVKFHHMEGWIQDKD